MAISIKAKIIQSIQEIEKHYNKGLKDDNRLVDLIETFQRQKKRFTDSEQTEYSQRLELLKQKKIQIVVPKHLELYDQSPASSPHLAPISPILKPEPLDATPSSPSGDSFAVSENECKEGIVWV